MDEEGLWGDGFCSWGEVLELYGMVTTTGLPSTQASMAP
jgi:hypothetical protein